MAEGVLRAKTQRPVIMCGLAAAAWKPQTAEAAHSRRSGGRACPTHAKLSNVDDAFTHFGPTAASGCDKDLECPCETNGRQHSVSARRSVIYSAVRPGQIRQLISSASRARICSQCTEKCSDTDSLMPSLWHTAICSTLSRSASSTTSWSQTVRALGSGRRKIDPLARTWAGLWDSKKLR